MERVGNDGKRGGGWARKGRASRVSAQRPLADAGYLIGHFGGKYAQTKCIRKSKKTSKKK